MNQNKTYRLLVDGRPSLQFASLEEAKTYVLSQGQLCEFYAELPRAPAPSQKWLFDFDLADWVLQS
ncbi:MAG: hypothetical protein HKP55_10090 [Gammaproteobacteria bacterium]|nr:hypothetical protein [Gammaproteobacteria bacterium]